MPVHCFWHRDLVSTREEQPYSYGAISSTDILASKEFIVSELRTYINYNKANFKEITKRKLNDLYNYTDGASAERQLRLTDERD